jgi:TonB family protein
MTALFYILKFILCSGLLYGYYYFALRNRRFHRYNRFYLLAIVPLSAIIPALHIPLPAWSYGSQHPIQQTIQIINAGKWEEPVTIFANKNGWAHFINIQNGFLLVYLIGVLVGCWLLFRSLRHIAALRKQYPFEQMQEIKLYQTSAPGTPFSFFRSIFWNKQIALDQPEGEQIFRHEYFHVQQQHSADVLFMEMATSIAWFNPFFHLIRREIKAIHEFLADEYALSGSDHLTYAEMLITQAIEQKTNPLTHPFFHHQLKRRIQMITSSNLIRRSGYLRRILALPLLLLIVSSFAVKLTNDSLHFRGKTAPASSLTFVVDPGHGGAFAGAYGENGLIEKDLNLTIAQKIKELAPSYNIKVVLTRESDQTVGNAKELKEDLENRVRFAQNIDADAFVSIHVNSTPEKITFHSGFEADVLSTANTQTIYWAHTMLQSVKEVYTSEEAVRKRQAPLANMQNGDEKRTYDQDIRKRQGGLYILQNQSVPAFILECGYINNPKDAAFISEPKNQESIARKILEGMVHYQQSLAIGVNVGTEQVSDTLSAESVSKLNPDDIKSISADMKTDLVTISLKNGTVKFASAKAVNSYYNQHKEVEFVKKANFRVDMKDSVVRISPETGASSQISQVTFTQTEKQAQYPGGQTAWNKYLAKNLKYPQKAQDNEVQGTVIVQFIVDVDGSVSDIKAMSGPKELQAESIRMIKESGKWEPALQNGIKVKSYAKQPFSFRLFK